MEENKPFRAEAKLGGKTKHLGYFATALQAATAYAWAIKLKQENASPAAIATSSKRASECTGDLAASRKRAAAAIACA